MSFIEKMIKKSSLPIHYLKGNDQGDDCYWFIMCSAASYDKLEKQFKAGNINLSDYGVVVASGWGAIPSEEVKNKLINEYGANWDDYSGAME